MFPKTTPTFQNKTQTEAQTKGAATDLGQLSDFRQLRTATSVHHRGPAAQQNRIRLQVLSLACSFLPQS